MFVCPMNSYCAIQFGGCFSLVCVWIFVLEIVFQIDAITSTQEVWKLSIPYFIFCIEANWYFNTTRQIPNLTSEFCSTQLIMWYQLCSHFRLLTSDHLQNFKIMTSPVEDLRTAVAPNCCDSYCKSFFKHKYEFDWSFY